MSLHELICGSYEEFTLGYKYTPENPKLTQSFASHSHSASIRCLAQCGPYIATGGADDRIVVYNLKARKEQCMLTHHNGTVNSLRFNDECTHLFSAGQDGVFAITRIGNWIVEKSWEKAHMGEPVVDIAVHKTSKLALTLGLDYTLRTWNLVKGRQAYVINLNSKCLDVRGLTDVIFSPDEMRFVLSGGRATEVWSIDPAGQIGIVDHGSKKVSCCAWLDKDTLLAGLDDGTVSRISIGSTNKPTVTSTHKAHDSRVKCLSTVNVDDNTYHIVSAASSGEIKVWADDFDSCLSRTSADCRLTCLVVANISSYVKEETIQKPIDANELIMKTLIQSAKPAKRKGIVVIEEDNEKKAKVGKKWRKKNKKYIKHEEVVKADKVNVELTKAKNKITKEKVNKKLEIVTEISKGIKKKKFKIKSSVK